MFHRKRLSSCFKIPTIRQRTEYERYPVEPTPVRAMVLFKQRPFDQRPFEQRLLYPINMLMMMLNLTCGVTIEPLESICSINQYERY